MAQAMCFTLAIPQRQEEIMTRFTPSSILPTTMIALAVLAGLSNTLIAQTYPSRSVRFVVPFAAGGPSDVAARIVGEALSIRLGQSIVIENRPGGDGLVAAQAVQSASADGYTLLFSGSTIVPLSVLKDPRPFDVTTDFAPVSQITRLEWAMYVSPHVPASSIAEFIAYGRGNPDKLSYASNNLVEDSAAVQLMKATGIKMVRVPYKGAGQAVADLVAGRVQVNFAPVSAYPRDGQLRMLAVLMPGRSRFAPDVPSLAEAGVSDVSVPGWQAILAPAKTPREIIDRLNSEINQALNTVKVRAQFERQNVQVQGSTAEGLAVTIKEELRAWSEFIRKYGIALQ